MEVQFDSIIIQKPWSVFQAPSNGQNPDSRKAGRDLKAWGCKYHLRFLSLRPDIALVAAAAIVQLACYEVHLPPPKTPP